MSLGKKFINQNAKLDQHNYLLECEKIISRMCNLHQISIDKINWENGFDEEILKPSLQSKKYCDLLEKQKNYVPSFWDKIFCAVSRKKEDMEIALKIQENIDKKNYETDQKNYNIKMKIKKAKQSNVGLIQLYETILNESNILDYIKEFSIGNPSLQVFEDRIVIQLSSKILQQIFPEKNKVSIEGSDAAVGYKIKDEILDKLNIKFFKSQILFYYKILFQLLPNHDIYEFEYISSQVPYFNNKSFIIKATSLDKFDTDKVDDLFDEIVEEKTNS